jgi:putative protein-disulfide isomerase
MAETPADRDGDGDPEHSPPSLRRILYFSDPMCSWCYGFLPVLDAIMERFGDRAPVWPVLTGLRPGTREPMDEDFKAHLRETWERVHAATGQPFGFALFARDDFVYDTEPSCRAVVTVRELAPALSLDFLALLQHAFYSEGADITRGDTLTGFAGQLGIEPALFGRLFASAAATEATAADFRLSRSLGIDRFPSVVLQDGTRYAYLTAGYKPWAELEPTLTGWLAAAP